MKMNESEKMKMNASEKLLAGFGAAAAGFALIFAMCALTAYPLKWCWNYTMPFLFHLPEIGALHGFCLSLLGSYLFKAKVDLKCKHDD